MEVARTKKKSKAKKKFKKTKEHEAPSQEDRPVHSEEEEEHINEIPISTSDDVMKEFQLPSPVKMADEGDLMTFDSLPTNEHTTTGSVSIEANTSGVSDDDKFEDALTELTDDRTTNEQPEHVTMNTPPSVQEGTIPTVATPPIEQVTPSVVTSPVEQVTPPVEQTTPPVEQTTPPVEQVTPPVEQVTPPVEQSTPPVEQVTPPVEQVTPPVEQVTVIQIGDTVPSAPPQLLYPTLDSLISGSSQVNELIPYTEDDLSLLYPNPQLAANHEFIDNFLKESRQNEHPLYELLNQYLTARLASKVVEGKIKNLRKKYSANEVMIWTVETKTISSNGKCLDGKTTTHTHTHKYAQFNNEPHTKTNDILKCLHNTLQEEFTMQSYSAQLACIHIEFYIHQLLHSLPGLANIHHNAPVTAYIPNVPPGSMDEYTSELRNSISVLFMFERRPLKDEQFSNDCRRWLTTLMSGLIRVSSLPDHLFILNHVLRCPPGVCEWATGYIQPLSPLSYKATERQQTNAPLIDLSLRVSHDYGQQRAGPIIDHWVTMLATLFQPIIGREEFLSCFSTLSPRTTGGAEEEEGVTSQRWTFVEDDEEQPVIDEDTHMMLKESDYISILDQFNVTDIFKYLLCTGEGQYTAEHTTSYQMLQFMSFCTCLIRLFGSIFSILRHSTYKEFIKQVGRTIRQIVHYVADHWSTYKSIKISNGASMSDVPNNEDPLMRYSLQRLQVEFDQFVLRATQWILSAHKLGAWQFMADMPYGSLSLLTLWQILWTLYHYQMTNTAGRGGGREGEGEGVRERRGSVLNDRIDLDNIPQTPEDIMTSSRSSLCRAKFIDVLMKTYTSEAVFLLTTFVNMARNRVQVHDSEEVIFINFIAQEIFQFTQVEEYARDAYSTTGYSLLGSIATVHPFIISTLIDETRQHLDQIEGDNIILLYKELPLHLWIPSEHHICLIRDWLVSNTVQSPHHLIAKIIISGLNWGVKEEREGKYSLVLPLSYHHDTALCIVDLWHRVRNYGKNNTSASLTSKISQYASSIRSTLFSSDNDLYQWMWDIVLMLKLHPTQLVELSVISGEKGDPTTASKDGAREPPVTGAKNPSVYKEGRREEERDVSYFDLPSYDDPGFDILRESMSSGKGTISCYVALCMTSLGTDPVHYVPKGQSFLETLFRSGYYLPVLKLIANITPLMFDVANRKIMFNKHDDCDGTFLELMQSFVHCDSKDVSNKESQWARMSSTVLIHLSSLITTQLQLKDIYNSESVLSFWLNVLFSIPEWLTHSKIGLLLDNICHVVYGQKKLETLLCERIIEQYSTLKPLAQIRGRISSITSSVLSIIDVQHGEAPSLYNDNVVTNCPLFAYYVVLSEHQYHEQKGVWNGLLKQLKDDQNISLDNALKKTLSELGHEGSSFSASNLSIYRWCDMCTRVGSDFVLLPLIWQRFFSLYLQRPLLTDNSIPERGSFGLRFFSTSRTQTIRRNMKTSLNEIVRELRDSLTQRKQKQDKTTDDVLVIEILPKIIAYYQTLKLWLEEPRLHDQSLYLPSLPIQYEPDKLTDVFMIEQEDWSEFIQLWKIEESITTLTDKWKEVFTYQKQFSFQSETHQQSPAIAASRMSKRLGYKTEPIPPPSFNCPSTPFSLVSTDVLLSKDNLLSAIMNDISFIAQQGRLYSEKFNSLVALNSEYMTGVVDLYSNQPRQFHVSVPCYNTKNYTCKGPATIVFRFDELTPHPHWETRLPQNRQEFTELVNTLSFPISIDLCKAVARTEHAIGELSKFSHLKDSEALSSGAALFFEVLKFINSETKQFPPSCQYLTSCIEILGQEFIQNDPSQTGNILQLLLTQHSLGGLLAPLFDPNVSPNEFVSMYSKIIDIAIKEGANIAFSVLTKFNIIKWIDEYNPSVSECTQLLECIFHGITYCGRDPPSEVLVLLEGYLTHFKRLVDYYQFPSLFNKTLQLIIDGTDVMGDSAGITPRCWTELLQVTTPPDSAHNDSCRLGLQMLQECVEYITNFYNQKRLYTQEPLYELLSCDFIVAIMEFIKMLSCSLVTKYCTSIELGNTTGQKALDQCWFAIVDLFRPWIFPLHSGEELMFPCKLESAVVCAQNVKVFAEVIRILDSKLNVGSSSVLSLVWSFYCNELTQSPDYILQSYHIHLTCLPWQQYIPDIPAMNLMLKLKIDSNFSKSCFVFLGDLFPLFDWKSIAEHYCTSGDSSLPIQFHVTLLQLLVMLAAEPDVMNKKESLVPQLLSEAKSFAFHYIDLKTYQDILQWQKSNCYSSQVLQSGSPLSSALRLLKAAGSFPINNDSKPLQLHEDGWDKRYSFIRLVVELISSTTQQTTSASNSYCDVITFLIETIIDVVVYEPESLTSLSAVYLLQEVFNLFNTCSPTESLVTALVSHITDCMEQLPNASRLYLPTLTAASRVLVSIPIMVKLLEEIIRIYFTHYTSPLQEDTGYGWGTLSNCLSIPETAHQEFCTVCVQEFACLCLNMYLRQQLPRCTSINGELDIAVKIVQWTSSLKPKTNEEYKILLIWDKTFNLLLRQLMFGGNIPVTVNLFTTLANLLLRLGEDKATEGLLGAIGLGRKSSFSLEFRLISRVLATYIHCQMPLDSSQAVRLRTAPNAPGHVKDPSRHAPGNALAVATATKQADQACTGLESLLSNKAYIDFRDYVTYSLEMINDPQCNLMNVTELFVYLLINLYPSVRCLESIKIVRTQKRD